MFGFHVSREWASGSRPPIAAHVEAAESIFYGHASEDVAQGFAFQVFIAGPRNQKFTVDVEEARGLKAYIQSRNARGRMVWGVAHGAYQDVPWNSEKANIKWIRKWIRLELRRAAAAGLAGLVIHLHTTPPDVVVDVLPELVPGIATGDPKRLFTLDGELDTGVPFELSPESQDEVKDIKFWTCFMQSEASVRPKRGDDLPDCVRLYLEVPAVLPKNSHYETPAKLRVLFEGIRKWVDPHLQYFGLCIDTAHIWASGADIASFEDASAWLAELEALHWLIPPRAIIFHLNDNVHPLGSGKDEHDCLLMGAIWGKYHLCPEKSGLAAFLDYSRRHSIPTILERKARKAGSEHYPETLTSRGAIDADLSSLKLLGVL